MEAEANNEIDCEQRKLHNTADNIMKSRLNKQFADEIRDQQKKV